MCTLQCYLGDDVLLGEVGELSSASSLTQLAGHLEVTVLQELHRDEISRKSTAHYLAGNADITGVHPVAGLLHPRPDRARLAERRIPCLNSIACSTWYLEIIVCC